MLLSLNHFTQHTFRWYVDVKECTTGSRVCFARLTVWVQWRSTGYSGSSPLHAKASQVGVIEMDGCWKGKRSVIVTSQMWL